MAPEAVGLTNKTVRPGSPAEGLVRLINRGKSRVRSRFEHVFAMVKQRWRFSKLRKPGLTKIGTRDLVVMALANLLLALKGLLA